MLLLLLAEVWIALKLCEFQSDHVLLKVKLSYLSFQFVWVSKKLVESVFTHFFFCFRSVSQDDYNLGMMEVILMGVMLNKSLAQFFLQLILSNIGMKWLCILNTNPNVVIYYTFYKCFLYVLELTFKHLSFTKTSFVAPFHVTQTEAITFFDCLLVWWKRQLSWILSLFSNPYTRLLF